MAAGLGSTLGINLPEYDARVDKINYNNILFLMLSLCALDVISETR